MFINHNFKSSKAEENPENRIYIILALEDVLFVYIVKQNKNNSRIFTKNFVDFQNFQKFNEDWILMETNIWNFDHS